MQETWILSLGWEDSLEKEMATHCSILAMVIPWIEEPGGLQSVMELQRIGHNWATEHTRAVMNAFKRAEISCSEHIWWILTCF